jgi:hypothetical protein
MVATGRSWTNVFFTNKQKPKLEKLVTKVGKGDETGHQQEPQSMAKDQRRVCKGEQIKNNVMYCKRNFNIYCTFKRMTPSPNPNR